jgi:signal peptidase I
VKPVPEQLPGAAKSPVSVDSIQAPLPYLPDSVNVQKVAWPTAAPELAPLTRRQRASRSARKAVHMTAGIFLVYLLAFHTPVVRGGSMQPGLQDGDRILVEPWSEIMGYHRGDIVVMRYPLDLNVDYVKRIIGLPGDEIVLANGMLWVNGELLDEPYVASVDKRAFIATTVRSEHFFVLGDNRPRSSDSREFGQVKSELIRGRVGLRMWPLGRVGFLN